MNIFELVTGTALTTSVAFCFLFQRPDAPMLAFTISFGTIGFIVLGAQLVYALVRLFRRHRPAPEAAVPRRSSTWFPMTAFVIAGVSAIAAACTLWSVPALPGTAALAALFSAVSGSGRRQQQSFLLLAAVLLISMTAHLFYRFQHAL